MTALTDHGPTWVVGAGGLLGTALVGALRRRGQDVFGPARIDWSDADRARTALSQALTDFMTGARDRGPWRILWCAGAGVTGASAADIDQEVATFAHFLDELEVLAAPGSGILFTSSSAGGVYAGSLGAPFSESSFPVAISAYGKGKLAIESRASDFGRRTANRVVLGRIANLYGPGQNLRKAQGLVSHLCRSTLTRQPLSIYVSLDTIRDYLFVDDCAEMIVDSVSPRPWIPDQSVTLKVFASQRGTTIADLIGECRRVFKRAPLVVLGTSANARFQVRDLRLRSEVWTDLDRRSLTTLPAGIAATAASLLRATQLSER